MKKCKLLFILTTSCFLYSCGNNTPQESNSHSSDNSFVISDESVASQKTDLELASDEKSEVLFDMRGISMQIPNNFEEANVFSKRVWNNPDCTIYYDIDYVPDYSSVASEESYNLEDTPDIMWEYVLEVVDKFFQAGPSKSSYSVDKEERRSMVGYDVIRRTGTIHAEKYGDTHELNYAAYYGLFDLQNGDYKKVPTVWIAFSELEDTSTLEEVVDLAFDNAKISN